MKLLNTKLPHLAVIAVLPLMLAMGCSSSGNGGTLTAPDDDTTDGGTTGGGTTDGGDGTDIPAGTPTLRLGRGFGEQFEEGQLRIDSAQVGAGGRTTVAVTLADESGAPRTDELTVTFSSECERDGTATIDTPVTTTTGRAEATYVARGCSGSDTVTATSSGAQNSASGVVMVTAAQLGSLQFISADPDNIALRGAGGAGRQETSTVIFRVRDTSGGNVSRQLVRFSLSTDVGGITLSSNAECSDGDGNVQTVVQAGDVATTVRVTAELFQLPSGQCDASTSTGTSRGSTQSDELTISTGVPDSDSFTIGIQALNLRSLDRVGITNRISVFLADRFNNPVPNGTAVQFRTESGSIVSQCSTDGDDGNCSVDLTTQNPKPTDGRVSVMAFVIGEESFDDENGNGVFDGDGDAASGTLDIRTADLPEAFLDSNENGQRDSGEEFIDFNRSGSYDTADGKQSSVLCADANRCLFDDVTGRAKLLNVFTQGRFILSGPPAQFLIYRPGQQPFFRSDVTIPCNNGNALPRNGLSCMDGANQYVAVVCDANSNVLEAGAMIAVSATEAMVSDGATTDVPNTLSAAFSQVPFSLTPSGDDDAGTVTITVTTPAVGNFAGGSVRTQYFASGCAD